jgi:hypothetical protein
MDEKFNFLQLNNKAKKEFEEKNSDCTIGKFAKDLKN